MRSLTALTLLALLAALPAAVSAAPIFSFVVPQASYTVNAGSSVSVPIYLQEFAAADDSDSLLSSHDGLATAGVEVSQSASPLVTISAVTANTATGVPSAFDPPAGLSALPSTDVTLQLSDDFSRPDGTNVPPVGGLRQILLGTFTFSAAAAAAGPVTFAIADPGATTDTLLFSDLTPLDAQIAATTVKIDVQPAPEPSAALLLVAALPALLLRRRPPEKTGVVG